MTHDPLIAPRILRAAVLASPQAVGNQTPSSLAGEGGPPGSSSRAFWGAVADVIALALVLALLALVWASGWSPSCWEAY